MPYLIDGYNLLHALGQPTGKTRRGARGRLLELLRRGHGSETGQVTIVFDAAQAPPGVAPDT